MATFTVTEEMDIKRCPSCHMLYAAPRSFFARMLELHDRGEKPSWSCPAGHDIIFSAESELDKVRRERDRLKQEEARLSDETRKEVRKRLAAETALKSHQRRTAAGVCPCCHRSFRQLALHMKSKHPDEMKRLSLVASPSSASSKRSATRPPTPQTLTTASTTGTIDRN